MDHVRFFKLQEATQFRDGNKTQPSFFHVEGMNPEPGLLQLPSNWIKVGQRDDHVYKLVSVHYRKKLAQHDLRAASRKPGNNMNDLRHGGLLPVLRFFLRLFQSLDPH